MKIERRTVTSREEWLVWRRENVGASEIAAAFGEHPYLTALELYQRKSDPGAQADQDNAVLRRGRIFEGAVADALREDYPDWEIDKANDYFVETDLRLGATPDFYITRPDRDGLGVLQAKTLGPQTAQEWGDGTAPLWITLQALTEAMLSGADYAMVAGLTISAWNPVVTPYEIERHAAAEEKIRTAAADFWRRVREGDAPAADYARDGDLLSRLYADASGPEIDLSADNMLPDLLDERARLSSEKGAAEKRLKAINAEILDKLGNAASARIATGVIRAPMIERKGYTVEPSSYRRITFKKDEAE